MYLSLLITATGIFSTMLSSRGVSLPTMQSSLNYMFLAIFLLARRAGPLRVNWWWYLFVAVVDVEANFLVRRNEKTPPPTPVAAAWFPRAR